MQALTTRRPGEAHRLCELGLQDGLGLGLVAKIDGPAKGARVQ